MSKKRNGNRAKRQRKNVMDKQQEPDNAPIIDGPPPDSGVQVHDIFNDDTRAPGPESDASSGEASELGNGEPLQTSGEKPVSDQAKDQQELSAVSNDHSNSSKSSDDSPKSSDDAQPPKPSIETPAPSVIETVKPEERGAVEHILESGKDRFTVYEVADALVEILDISREAAQMRLYRKARTVKYMGSVRIPAAEAKRIISGTIKTPEFPTWEVSSVEEE
ncbi:MAG: hypothetical protein OEY63_09135 [Gemmatimonadota bacterium]|nr:hypothetical protein [Gemmatimonadota bacterium]